MFSLGQVVYIGFAGLFIGAFLVFFCTTLNTKDDTNNDATLSSKTEKILASNNILLKISLWKMIIGFAPKDELGRYYTSVNGFVSDAFCRLGIESHTINEQMALDKIANLDKALREL